MDQVVCVLYQGREWPVKYGILCHFVQGAVSKTLLKKGGDAIQQELRTIGTYYIRNLNT